MINSKGVGIFLCIGSLLWTSQVVFTGQEKKDIKIKGQKDISQEDLAIIKDLDLLEILEMLEEDIEFLDDYNIVDEIEEKDEK